MTEIEIPDFHSLLVIGVDSVSLAASAKRAGYKVFAVDHFGDQDLKRVCRESLSVIKQRQGRSCGHLSSDFSPEVLLQLTKALLKRHDIDAVFIILRSRRLSRYLVRAQRTSSHPRKSSPRHQKNP